MNPTSFWRCSAPLGCLAPVAAGLVLRTGCAAAGPTPTSAAAKSAPVVASNCRRLGEKPAVSGAPISVCMTKLHQARASNAPARRRSTHNKFAVVSPTRSAEPGSAVATGLTGPRQTGANGAHDGSRQPRRTRSRRRAVALAERENLHLVRSFHPLLVRGVASYALELFRAVAGLDTVYVPVGLGSGICGVIAARDALGLTTEVVGAVAENAPTYALSFAAGRPVPTNRSDTLAEGIAVRVPDPEALAIILKGAGPVVTRLDAEIRHAA